MSELSQARPAELTLAGIFRNRVRLDSEVQPLGPERLGVALPEGYDAIRFAWVEFTLPQGDVVRPLVEFEARSRRGVGVVPGYVVYLDPADRRALDAYTAAAGEAVSAH